eukprot:1158719-Pelagomonas_calceolata.AAC.1
MQHQLSPWFSTNYAQQLLCKMHLFQAKVKSPRAYISLLAAVEASLPKSVWARAQQLGSPRFHFPSCAALVPCNAQRAANSAHERLMRHRGWTAVGALPVLCVSPATAAALPGALGHHEAIRWGYGWRDGILEYMTEPPKAVTEQMQWS